MELTQNESLFCLITIVATEEVSFFFKVSKMRGIPYSTFYPNEDPVPVHSRNIISPDKFFVIMESSIDELQALTSDMR